MAASAAASVTLSPSEAYLLDALQRQPEWEIPAAFLMDGQGRREVDWSALTTWAREGDAGVEFSATQRVEGTVRVGAGSEHLPFPAPSCAYTHVRLWADITLPPSEQPPLILSNQDLGYGAEPVCGRLSTNYLELTVDATYARATCDTCALASSQVSLLPPNGPTSYSDFGYVTLRGQGTLGLGGFCGAYHCVWIVFLTGNGAIVELHSDEPPHLFPPRPH